MSDYLTRLVELTLGLAPTVRPRTVPMPEIIVPYPPVVDAGDGRPSLRRTDARDTLREKTSQPGPDEAGDETSLAGPATTPRADVSHPGSPNDAATPSRGPRTGDPSVTRGPSARPETPPTGEDPAPHPVPLDEAHRPAGPSTSGHRQAGEKPLMDTPEEVRRGRTSPDSRPEEHAGGVPAPPVEDETDPASGLLPPARQDGEPFPERSVSGGRAPAPVELRTAAEPRRPGEIRPQTHDAAAQNRGDDPGPGRVRSFGAPTFAFDARERPPVLPETSDPAERLVGMPDSQALAGAPSVRRDGAAGSSEILPAVRITIGRVEARAIPTGEAPARSAPRAPGAASERRGPALSLDDYLKRRGGRG